MERFKVVLEGVKLEPAQAAKMQSAIEKAVLGQLADIDFGGDSSAKLFKPPMRGPIDAGDIFKWKWRGLYAIVDRGIALNELNETAINTIGREFQQ